MTFSRLNVSSSGYPPPSPRLSRKLLVHEALSSSSGYPPPSPRLSLKLLVHEALSSSSEYPPRLSLKLLLYSRA
jgi:hypothetical protein